MTSTAAGCEPTGGAAHRCRGDDEDAAGGLVRGEDGGEVLCADGLEANVSMS